jgi:hypothetical protein
MLKILKQIKNSPFKYPKKKHYIGETFFGAPYFYPRPFNANILTFRKLIETPQEELDKLSNSWMKEAKRFKNKPLVYNKSTWIFKLLGCYYYLSIGSPIWITWHGLGWKDKYDSPRFEWRPSFYIFFFKWQLVIWWGAPDGDDDRYYEMILWYLHYSKKNIIQAEETWGWVDYTNKKSTWNNEYLK